MSYNLKVTHFFLNFILNMKSKLQKTCIEIDIKTIDIKTIDICLNQFTSDHLKFLLDC